MIKKLGSITYADIKDKLVLSPLRYYTFHMNTQNSKPLSSFLDPVRQFEKGSEPGQKNYVELSPLAFIRTSCFAEYSYRVNSSKLLYLHPHRCKSIQLEENDILLVKDGSIGESAIVDRLLLNAAKGGFNISSGVVKLNIVDIDRYYLLAVLKSDIFRNQLRILVGLGTTITHAGSNFLKCNIPLPVTPDDEQIISSLSKAIICKETQLEKKWNKIMNLITKEVSLPRTLHEMPTYSAIKSKQRLDASTYSFEYQHYLYEISKYQGGFSSIADLGFETKRGPSLQVRDAGRILYSNERLNNSFWIAIKPIDVSLRGSINTFQFLGNRQMKWSFKRGDVLFSAEGTIGKTFVFCDAVERITTNIHSVMLGHNKVEESIFLGCILGYLRERGILDKISVGGQGGSLALAHWDNLFVPILKSSIKRKICDLYYDMPTTPDSRDLAAELQFHIDHSNKYGIFQLDMQIRYFRSILNELIKRVAGGKTVCKKAIYSHIENLSFQNSFDSFKCA